MGSRRGLVGQRDVVPRSSLLGAMGTPTALKWLGRIIAVGARAALD